MPTQPIRFRCHCGRTVVTAPGTLADEVRSCTRCRLRALRLGDTHTYDGDLTRHDQLAEGHAARAVG
jgi:hypothetical protein